MKPLRLVLDSNVFISALLFGGPPRAIIEKTVAGQFHAAISLAIMDEIRDVLRRPKFGLSEEQILAFIAEVQDLCEIVTPENKVYAVNNDPDDNRILECALAAHADVIVSGDSHLLELKQWRQIPIYAPSDFLRKFTQEG